MNDTKGLKTNQEQLDICCLSVVATEESCKKRNPSLVDPAKKCDCAYPTQCALDEQKK